MANTSNKDMDNQANFNMFALTQSPDEQARFDSITINEQSKDIIIGTGSIQKVKENDLNERSMSKLSQMKAKAKGDVTFGLHLPRI